MSILLVICLGSAGLFCGVFVGGEGGGGGGRG